MFQVLARLDAHAESAAASPLRMVAPASLAHRFLVPLVPLS